MNKDEIRKVLAAYSPPLSPSQIEEASDRISELPTAVEPVKKEEPTRKARR